MFGFEKKIKIPYSHISKVSKKFTAVVIPNAVAIITKRGEYFFRSFWDRDEAYCLLKSQLDQSQGQASSSLHSSPSSYPPSSSSSSNGSSKSNGHHSSIQSHRASQNHVENVVSRHDKQGRDWSEQQATQRFSGSREVNTLPARGRIETEEEVEDVEETGDTIHMNKRAAADPSAAFEKMQEKQFSDVLPVATLSVGLNEFATQFLMRDSSGGEDTEGLGVPAYHKAIGDTEVEVEPWENVAGDDAATATRSYLRTFRFRTPIVGSPIGPSSTRGTKTQCCRVYAKHGLIIDTVTRLEDIPFGDCFQVEDRWVVAPTKDGNGVTLTSMFRVHWMKGTWLKKTIESKTKVDVRAFQMNCIEAMQAQRTKAPTSKVSSTPKNEAVLETTSPTPTASRNTRSTLGILVLSIMITLVFMMQCAIILFSYKRQINEDLRWSEMALELAKLKELLETKNGGCSAL